MKSAFLITLAICQSTFVHAQESVYFLYPDTSQLFRDVYSGRPVEVICLNNMERPFPPADVFCYCEYIRVAHGSYAYKLQRQSNLKKNTLEVFKGEDKKACDIRLTTHPAC